MPISYHFHTRLRLLCVLVVGAATLSGCGSVQQKTHQWMGAVTPYRIDVVQGNFVSREQVQALQPGMVREQVRDILGTPLMTSVFHADRWEYVFTFRRPGQASIHRRLTVFFKADVLQRFEGDEMPTEAEFVASLESRSNSKKIPSLEATPEQLARYADTSKKPLVSEPVAPSTNNYPPLEAPATAQP
jgi:outer membrane protein assembly factor BamE